MGSTSSTGAAGAGAGAGTPGDADAPPGAVTSDAHALYADVSTTRAVTRFVAPHAKVTAGSVGAARRPPSAAPPHHRSGPAANEGGDADEHEGESAEGGAANGVKRARFGAVAGHSAGAGGDQPSTDVSVVLIPASQNRVSLLAQYFEQFGAVASVRVSPAEESAVVTFAAFPDAQTAVRRSATHPAYRNLRLAKRGDPARGGNGSGFGGGAGAAYGTAPFSGPVRNPSYVSGREPSQGAAAGEPQQPLGNAAISAVVREEQALEERELHEARARVQHVRDAIKRQADALKDVTARKVDAAALKDFQAQVAALKHELTAAQADVADREARLFAARS